MPCGPGGGEEAEVGGKMGGVIPNIMAVGFTTGDVGRDTGPWRRWRTAESRAGCKYDHDDERVEKSRMYMRRGLWVPLELSASPGGCKFMHISKKVLALTMLFFDKAPPGILDIGVGMTS